MKKILSIIAVILLLTFVLTACGSAVDEVVDAYVDSAADKIESKADDVGDDGSEEPLDEDPRYGTALNIDPDCLAYMYQASVGKTVDTSADAEFTRDLRAKLEKWYEDRYADCGISDILYNITWEESAEKYLRKTETLEDGRVVSVDYSDIVGARAAYLVKTNTDIDPYGVWFDMCRKDGINPWLSFRMNDVHSANESTGHSEFFYKAKKNGWLIGNARASYWLNNPCTQGSRKWYPYAYDYTYAEVREHFLSQIDAQLDKYDAYGIELDWQRTIWCFPTDTTDNIQYMDIFMEDVNEIVERYEEKYGHEIKISARIGRDIDENKYFGFDVENWANKDLIDVVIPSPYWGATDTAIPVTEWVQRLADYPKVDVWAGVECHVMNNSQWQSIPTLAAQTAQYLSQGADKMYLYNLFNDIKAKFEVCASLKNALAAAKRSYIVTSSNTAPYASGFENYSPLPISVTVTFLEPMTAIFIVSPKKARLSQAD